MNEIDEESSFFFIIPRELNVSLTFYKIIIIIILLLLLICYDIISTQDIFYESFFFQIYF